MEMAQAAREMIGDRCGKYDQDKKRLDSLHKQLRRRDKVKLLERRITMLEGTVVAQSKIRFDKEGTFKVFEVAHSMQKRHGKS